MSDTPVQLVDLGLVDEEAQAAPEERETHVPLTRSRTKQRQRANGNAQQVQRNDRTANSQQVMEDDIVDLTQTPTAVPTSLQPIVVDDTPIRGSPSEPQRQVLIDLTATTPRSGTLLRRVSTIERDFELARRLQEEEEEEEEGGGQAHQHTSQSSSSSTASALVDNDLLLARRLQEEEDEGLARRLVQAGRERKPSKLVLS